MKKTAGLTVFLLILATGGCGYHLVGSGSGLVSGINTISIPVFKNNSAEPSIERTVTSKVRDVFIQDGRLKVTSEDKADLLFAGNIADYELKPVAFDSNDNVTEYWVIMNIEVKVKEADKDSYLIDQTFRSRWNYKVSSEVISSESARVAAIEEASRDFAERMVSIVVEGF